MQGSVFAPHMGAGLEMVGVPKVFYSLKKGKVAFKTGHPPFKRQGCKARGPNTSEVPEEGPQQDVRALPYCRTPR